MMILNLAAGVLCGVLSGFGIGGGSLLMLWLTAVLSLDQRLAQGINLLYFLPTAAASLIFHVKNQFINWSAVIPAAICGAAAAAAAAFLASRIDTSLLRTLFGVFLLFVGIVELRKQPAQPERKDK